MFREKWFKKLMVKKLFLLFISCSVPGARDSNSLYSEECAQIHGSQRLAMVEAACTCYTAPQCTPHRGRTQSNQGKFKWDWFVLYRCFGPSTGCYSRAGVSEWWARETNVALEMTCRVTRKVIKPVKLWLSQIIFDSSNSFI